MALNGIDISGWQSGIDLTKVPCDFVIVKATQGTTFTNSDCARAVEQALSAGKCVGVYHYVTGGNANSEADFFVNSVRGWLGRAVLAIDWESAQNSAWNNGSYLEAIVSHVISMTGIKPLIYASASVLGTVQPIANKYNCGLWIAQYANNNSTGYQDSPWNEGTYSCAIRQYSSTGRLTGYNGNLDLDKFYGDVATWNNYAASTTNIKVTTTIDNEEEEMHCIIQLNDESGLNYYDGVKLHPLSHPDEVTAIQMVAKKTLGHELPVFKLGSTQAPWGTRFRAAVTR